MKSDFITKWFHPTIVVFIPSVRTDLVEKREQVKDLLSFFWRRHPEFRSAVGRPNVANRNSACVCMVVARKSVWIVWSVHVRSFSSPSRAMWGWRLQNKNGTRTVFVLRRVDKKDATLKMTKNLIFQGLSAFYKMFSNLFSRVESYSWKLKSWQKECLCFPPTNYNWSISLLYHILWTFQTLEFIRFDGFHTVKPNFIIRP